MKGAADTPPVSPRKPIGERRSPRREPRRSPRDTHAARLKTKYEDEVLPQLKDRFDRQNELALPKLKKIVISMGLGEASRDSKLIDQAQDMLSIIAGQKSARRKATKSISQFRLREGTEVGVMVTLRGARMYEFLDRLIALALPRVRDFRGLNPKAFDGAGNYNMGLSEQYVFPEVDPDRFPNQQGMKHRDGHDRRRRRGGRGPDAGPRPAAPQARR